MVPFLSSTLLGVLLLALSSVATAQPELRFKQIDVEDGLPHNTVLSILQDRKGFMWFATQDGLCRYDGYAFTVFRHQLSDSTSLSSNKIMSILEDREGYIWVGTQATGLNRFDPETETFIRFRIDSAKGGSQDNLWVSELLEDQQGDIWGATFGGGLFRYDKSRNSFERFTYQADDPRSISSNDLNSMAIDGQGNIWIGAVGGLNRFDPRTAPSSGIWADRISLTIFPMTFSQNCSLIKPASYGLAPTGTVCSGST
jgi:ligand-binding sensor domain-containing protein